MHAAPPNSLPHSLLAPRLSRRRGLTVLAAVVLAVHLLALDRVHEQPGSGLLNARPQPLQVRQIPMPAATLAESSAKVAAPAAAEATGPRPLLNVDRERRLQARAAPANLRPAVRPAAQAVVSAASAPATPAAATAEANSPGMEAPAALAPMPHLRQMPPAAGANPLPAYHTRPPPAMTLNYTVRQGHNTGQAELRWHPADGRYRLTLERSGAAQTAQGSVQGSVSQGELGAFGLAPERYAETRRGREQRAVNFQHEAGLITFSGPQLQYLLLPGAQDRLSWMLQLAAILEAEPALREPGSEVLLFVAGTRGDGQVWTFTVQGRQALELPAGLVAGALHLRRMPSRPYDTQVDVWLDPARHHVPARLLLQFHPAATSMDWVLGPSATP